MSASTHRIYHRLQLAAHRIQKAADRALLAAADITTSQAAVLSIVAAQGTVTQRTVAKQLGLNESALTAMTNRLLSHGLLERLRDEADSRAWRLELTKDGAAALKKAEQPFRRINQQLDSILGPDGADHFGGLLQRISAAFEE